MRQKRGRKPPQTRHRFANGVLLLLSLFFAFVLLRNESFHAYILHLGHFEYIGVFVAGMFLVSTFTIVPATVVLLVIAETLPAWVIAPIAGLGGMLGDFMLYQLVRNKDVAKEVDDIFDYFGGKKLRHMLYSRHFRWMLPVLGAIIIASPLPDELGVSLMGISKLPPKYFLAITYFLDTIGVLILLSLSLVIKP